MSNETATSGSSGLATPICGRPKRWGPMESPRSPSGRFGPHRCGSAPPSFRPTPGGRRSWPRPLRGLRRQHPGGSCSASARPPTSSWSVGTESRSRSRSSRPETWSVSSRPRSAARRSPRPTTPSTSRASDSAWCLSSRYRFSWRRFARDAAHGWPRKRWRHHQLAVGRQRRHRRTSSGRKSRC